MGVDNPHTTHKGQGIQPINTSHLQASLDAGHTLDPTTIQRLLDTVKDYQDNPRGAGPGLQLPELKPAKDHEIVWSQYTWNKLLPTVNPNPILGIVEEAARSMADYLHARNLVIDPTSIRFETIPDNGNHYTTRLTAYAKPRQEKP